jgi:hypothetical protein
LSKLKDLLISKLSLRKLEPLKFGGLDCFVKVWNEKERIEYAIDAQTRAKNGEPDYLTRCRTIVFALCDEAGEMIFSANDVELVSSFDSHEIGKAFAFIIQVQSNEADDSDAKKN